MYIVFDLHKSTLGSDIRDINQALHAWSDQHNIPYNTKFHKFTKRVTFDNEQTYSFFAMTWTGPEYRLVDPMKVDRS